MLLARIPFLKLTALAAAWLGFSSFHSLHAYESAPVDAYDQAVTISIAVEEANASHASPKKIYLLLKQLEKQLPLALWPEQHQNLLHQVAQKIQEHYVVILARAEELYGATLYHEAVPLYLEILEAIKEDLLPDPDFLQETSALAACRLGQAYFYMEDYEMAKIFFESPRANQLLLPSHLQELDRQSIYLQSLVYRHLENYDAAIQSLEKYLQSGNRMQLALIDEVQFELGLNYFLWGKLDQSKHYFEFLGNKSHKPQLYYLSRLYLSRIDLASGDFQSAEKNLSALSLLIPQQDALRFELSYLRGEALFQMRDYAKAAFFFEQALPVRNHERAEWYPETLYNLGWCHLKASDNPAKTPEEKRERFDKAADYFKKLLEIADEERVYLALAQCYLARANALKEEEAYIKAEQILSEENFFQTHEAKTHALLLRAEAAPSYEVRQAFYAELTQEANRHSPFYGKGWYLRGLNDFDHGQSLQKTGGENAKPVFEKAAFAFGQAFDLLKTNDPSCAALALKYQAQTYQYLGGNGLVKALEVLDAFSGSQSDLSKFLVEPEEIAYLYGLTACHLSDEKNGPLYIEAAEKRLSETAELYPQSPYAIKSLELLGHLFYRHQDYGKAHAAFMRLARNYPQSSSAGNALYWAANCLEKESAPAEEVRDLRRVAYEQYPQGELAPAACFNSYSYREYLQGDRSAMKHLQAFKEKFPQSPLLVNAYYLMGMDYKRDRKTAEGKWIRKKNLTEAIDAFFDAETAFDGMNEKGLIPADDMPYYVMIRYRAVLERALANLSIAEESQGAKRDIYLQYAEDVFKQINKELADPEHPLAGQLTRSNPFPPIQEEALYWLALTYMKSKNDKAAQLVIDEMLDAYHSNNITKSYFLSRILYEQGMLAMRHEDYEMAWQSFMRAEDTGKGKYLSVDQKLDLWIQQSLCYKALNQMDKAMLILSKVINDDAVSSLRLKAMYLRAEIYEMQGRHELARKQLEATSKKGGEWAQKAKMKLDKDYGYQ